VAGLTFDGLKKRYGDTQVLHGVDLQVDDGEYLILVGPSGCGKSTLLRCIAGLEQISGGELRIGGRRVNELPPKERDIAMVFQSYALYPHMTVRDNIGFPLRIQRRPAAEIDAAVAEVSALLGLSDLLDRTPGQLSGGQRQRVAMGRAIVRRPSVFLFDEPLSNLDASLRHQMRVELKKLHRTLETTIVHVTHDQVEALTLADRILVLEGGVVQQAGTPRELFDTPANTFVAQFIGSPSMNLLPVVDGRVQGTEQVVGHGSCTLGVRPTDLSLAGEGEGIEAVVDVVESLGAEALVHCTVGPHALLAVVKEPVELAVD
jgi:ABC-type sugar transport system ATPase subunit